MTDQNVPMLTGDELRAIELTAELVDLLAKITGDGPSREGDVAEWVLHIHCIQHTVMAQAAARAYPEQFRLLGEVIKRDV